MKAKIIKPKIDEQHKFGVAVPTDGGPLMIIETYATKKELEIGYAEWKQFAFNARITKPYPIELIGKNEECKILKEIFDQDV